MHCRGVWWSIWDYLPPHTVAAAQAGDGVDVVAAEVFS
jgi:hypothetical protein